MNRLTGAQLIYNSLKYYNIRHAFGYSGGAVLPLLNTFYKENNEFDKIDHGDGIKFIKSSNEQCAGHSAEGYTKSINNVIPGVIISTSGPGVTNILTPLQNAFNDGTPLIAITGQVPTNAIGTDAFQECPATDITKSSTKWNYLLNQVDNIPEVMKYAYDISMSPRMGPVHIDAPKDILSEMSNINIYDLHDKLREKKYYFNKEKDSYKIETKINNIIKLLNISKKPILKIGQGCNHSYKLLRKFIELTNIPVTTTIHGLGIVDETHPLSLQMMGMHGSAAANYALQEADLIIAIGTRFDDRTVGNYIKYAPEAVKSGISGKGGFIHVDKSIVQIDKVKKLFKSKINHHNLKTLDDINLQSLCMDSEIFLDKLVDSYDKRVDYYNDYKEWNKRIRILKEDNKFTLSNYKNNKNNKLGENLEIYNITTQMVIDNINKSIDKLQLDRSKIIYTTGVGNHQMFAAQHITWTHPVKMMTSGSLGTMGVGVPYAIGAQLSNPCNKVICIDGDGSFCMTSGDLQTVADLNIPIKICIMNDERQQMVHTWQKLFFNGRFIATDNKNPNFVKLAESYGIKALKCEDIYSLSRVTKEMLEFSEGPILVEYKVRPDICLPLVSPGKSLSEMILNVEDIDNMSVDKKNVPS